MDPIATFILAAIVFLSLPLPIFASAALESRPALRGPVLRCVWANQSCGAMAGLAIIATPLSPWLALTFATVAFIGAGAAKSRRLSMAAA